MKARTHLYPTLLLALLSCSCGGQDTEPQEDPAAQHDAKCSFESEIVLCRNSGQGSLNYIEEYGPLPEEMQYISLNHVEDLVALEKLSQVKKVGAIFIRSIDGVEDLSFLSGLEEAGDVEIAGNKGLRSLRGLENLTTITYQLRITGNGALETLQGLENVERVGKVDEGEGLTLMSNPKLKNLEALESLEESLFIHVQSNNAMRSFGKIPSLERLGSLSASFNNELQDLGSAPSLRDIVKGMVIEKNKKFPDCEAEKYLAQVEEFDAGFLFENNLPNSTCADLGQ